MKRPQILIALVASLLLLGFVLGRILSPAAAGTFASLQRNPQLVSVALDASAPAYLLPFCPGYRCLTERLAPPPSIVRAECVSASAVNAGMAVCNSAATVTLTQLDSGTTAGLWIALLSVALGIAGVIVLSSAVFFAMRLR